MIVSVINFGLFMAMAFRDGIFISYGLTARNEKRERWQLALFLMLLEIPISIIKMANGTNTTIRIVSAALVIASIFIYLLLFFKEPLWKIIVFLAILVSTTVITEMITVGIIYNPGLANYDQPVLIPLFIAELIIGLILEVIILFFWNRLVKKQSFQASWLILFTLFPVSQMVMLSTINISFIAEMKKTGIMFLISIFVSFAADVFLFVVIMEQQKKEELRQRLAQTQEAWRVEQNHYQAIEARREEIARIRHDLNSQIAAVRGLMQTQNYKQTEKMLESLTQSVQSTKEYEYCADPVVNAVMNENELMCREQNIRFEPDIMILQPLKLDPVVICSIFSNLLRNALAAAGQCPEEKRYIAVKAQIHGDYLHIGVDNSVTEHKSKKKSTTNEKQQDNSPQGAYGERKHYGINILNRLAEEYSGAFESYCDEQGYHSRISVLNMETADQKKTV